jgi:hypothetical protein
MILSQNFTDFNIGRVKVPVTLASTGKNDYAILMLVNEFDKPIIGKWLFPWENEIRKEAKSEKRILIKLEYREKVLGLVSYIVVKDKNIMIIEHLEAQQDLENRVAEPIGKWLLWYCYKVSMDFCLGEELSDKPFVLLYSKPRAFRYYKEKIGMTYQDSIRLEEGEIHVFTDSRNRAKEYMQNLLKRYGEPIFC